MSQCTRFRDRKEGKSCQPSKGGQVVVSVTAAGKSPSLGSAEEAGGKACPGGTAQVKARSEDTGR